MVGFMFGIFFSIWFNTIISRRANEAFGYRDAVIAGLLVLFLLLGAGRRGFVSQLFARVTDVKLPGGAELSLKSVGEESTSETSHYTLVPPSSTMLTSGGLRILKDIPAAIRRDPL
jgi:hypothetical protein